MISTADLVIWALYIVTAALISHRIGVSSAMPGRKLFYIFISALILALLFGVVRGLVFLLLCPFFLMFYPGSRLSDWLKAFRLTSAGRSFGNKIADSMLMSRTMFHNAIEAGGVPMHLITLAQIKFSGATVIQARGAVAPILISGLQALEQRFGPLAIITKNAAVLKQFYPNCDAEGAHAEAMIELASLIKNK